jgi:hypothetical protein
LVPYHRERTKGESVAERRHRAGRILIGIGIMIILAATPFVILSHYAGRWGVPYFTFTTDRGTTCTNDFTGYHCDHLTVSDITWWGDIRLPPGTRVVSSYYKSTHNFRLDAVVEIPSDQVGWTINTLRQSFGTCVPGHPTQTATEDLTSKCVRANDASDDESSRLPDTLYEITTGYNKKHVVVVGIHEESR